MLYASFFFKEKHMKDLDGYASGAGTFSVM